MRQRPYITQRQTDELKTKQQELLKLLMDPRSYFCVIVIHLIDLNNIYIM